MGSERLLYKKTRYVRVFLWGNLLRYSAVGRAGGVWGSSENSSISIMLLLLLAPFVARVVPRQLIMKIAATHAVGLARGLRTCVPLAAPPKAPPTLVSLLCKRIRRTSAMAEITLRTMRRLYVMFNSFFNFV